MKETYIKCNQVQEMGHRQWWYYQGVNRLYNQQLTKGNKGQDCRLFADSRESN